MVIGFSINYHIANHPKMISFRFVSMVILSVLLFYVTIDAIKKMSKKEKDLTIF